MKIGDREIVCLNVSDQLRSVLPIFGAHPLSNVYNQAPILLVEGEDYERIWQAAIRTSKGRLRLHPCEVGGISNMAEYENTAIEIIGSVYDNATAYSLRDRDENRPEPSDTGPLKRIQLSCRAAENLILTEEVLSDCGITWGDLQVRCNQWLVTNHDHPHFGAMQLFAAGGFDRRNSDIKELRNDLMGLIEKSAPWEVVVGRSTARLNADSRFSDHSLKSYLGAKAVALLLHIE